MTSAAAAPALVARQSPAAGDLLAASHHQNQAQVNQQQQQQQHQSAAFASSARQMEAQREPTNHQPQQEAHHHHLHHHHHHIHQNHYPSQQLHQQTGASTNVSQQAPVSAPAPPIPATGAAPPQVTVARKRGRRRQQAMPEQPNGLDRVFIWDIDGSLVRADTLGESQEPSVLPLMVDKLSSLSKRLSEVMLTFCEEQLFLQELEMSDQMHIDDVPSDHSSHHHHNQHPQSQTRISSLHAIQTAPIEVAQVDTKPQLVGPAIAAPLISSADSARMVLANEVPVHRGDATGQESLHEQLDAGQLDNSVLYSSASGGASSAPSEESFHQLTSVQDMYSGGEPTSWLDTQGQLQGHQHASLHMSYANCAENPYALHHQHPAEHNHLRPHHAYSEHQAVMQHHSHHQHHQFLPMQPIYHNIDQTAHLAHSQHHQATHLAQHPSSVHILQQQGHQRLAQAQHQFPIAQHLSNHHQHHHFHAPSSIQSSSEQSIAVTPRASLAAATNGDSAGSSMSSELQSLQPLGSYSQQDQMDGGVYSSLYGGSSAPSEESFHQLTSVQDIYPSEALTWAETQTAQPTAYQNMDPSQHQLGRSQYFSHHQPQHHLSQQQGDGQLLRDLTDHTHHHHHHHHRITHSHLAPIQQHEHHHHQSEQQSQLLGNQDYMSQPQSQSQQQQQHYINGSHQIQVNSASSNLHQSQTSNQNHNHHLASHQSIQRPDSNNNSSANNNNGSNNNGNPTTTLRTVLNNHHKQLTQKLSIRFHRIRNVYNMHREQNCLFKTSNLYTSTDGLSNSMVRQQPSSETGTNENNNLAQELQKILAEIDHYTLDWRKRSMDCLRLISESPNCTNIIVTKLPLVVALGHLVCLDLAQYFEVDQIYSASKANKETCIKRIKKRFGSTNRCSLIIVGGKNDVELAKKLDLPSWNTSHSDGHKQLIQLYTALKEGFLM